MEGMYILKGKEVAPCPDTIEWDKWFATANRKVARETIGDSDISTVFLGLNPLERIADIRCSQGEVEQGIVSDL